MIILKTNIMKENNAYFLHFLTLNFVFFLSVCTYLQSVFVRGALCNTVKDLSYCTVDRRVLHFNVFYTDGQTMSMLIQ